MGRGEPLSMPVRPDGVVCKLFWACQSEHWFKSELQLCFCEHLKSTPSSWADSLFSQPCCCPSQSDGLQIERDFYPPRKCVCCCYHITVMALKKDAIPLTPDVWQASKNSWVFTAFAKEVILCSQRWRSSIQSAKTRLGADWLRSRTPYYQIQT